MISSRDAWDDCLDVVATQLTTPLDGTPRDRILISRYRGEGHIANGLNLAVQAVTFPPRLLKALGGESPRRMRPLRIDELSRFFVLFHSFGCFDAVGYVRKWHDDEVRLFLR